ETRERRCHKVKASRLRANLSTVPSAAVRASLLSLSWSSTDTAARKSCAASSKYGVPGPVFLAVKLTAPAGMKDSRSPNLNPTQPSVVRNWALPERSTDNE